MMGKFSGQLKELPGTVDVHAPSPLTDRPTPAISAPRPEDTEHLRQAQALLERELTRTDLAPQEGEALREVLYSLRERNLQRIGSVYRQAFAELRNPSEALKQAYEHLEQFFASR
jgi:hypothetical protein